MSKDPDLNRDVQNELNQIFPEMKHDTYYPELAGVLKGCIINTLHSEKMDLNSARILRDSLNGLENRHGKDRTEANEEVLKSLNQYIKKHDKTSH